MASYRNLLLFASMAALVALSYAGTRYGDRRNMECCRDTIKNCHRHAQRGHCSSLYHGMMRRCCKTCRALGMDPCQDHVRGCKSYAAAKYCELQDGVGAYVRSFCCKSCCEANK